MKRLASFFFLLSFLLSSCMTTNSASSSPEPAPVAHTYAASDASLLNPERGFFTPYELPGPVGFSPVRATGNTLVHLNLRLDDWRDTGIPQEVLDGFQTNFDDIRAAGLKAIIRFAYNAGPYPDSEPDASKPVILHHIEQFTPLLQKNADVIAWVEAGFIGAWGEWHTSTNGLDNLTDKRDILNAVLIAIPNRFVQVRYPANIIEMYPDPMDAVKARVAHHNDCFLSSDTDIGTYERDGVNTIVRDQAYLAELTRFTPMSGETCAPNPPRSECNSAIREMELLHFSALNEAYHKGILRSWEQGGCLEEINNRLGYRLALTSANFNEQVRPGGLLDLRVSLTNTGFASLMNPRPLYVVLVGRDNISPYAIRLDLDPRAWQPGTSFFQAKIRLPSNMPETTYDLALWLPDEAETLQNNPLYAVRFANPLWDEATGYNVLGQVTVDDSVTGSFVRGEDLVVEELTATETALLATTTPAPTPTVAPIVGGLVTRPIVTREAERVVIQFAFAGDTSAYNGFQVFLDVDQNPKTGLTIEGIGADFLLENDTLNSYAGSGADWTWTIVEADLTFSNENQLAVWTLPLAALGDPDSIDVVFQLVDLNWDTAFVTPKMTFSLK